MRLFVGIPLAETARSELDRIVARIKPQLPGWRWSSAESWHITLQFLGNTRPGQYIQLTAQLRAIQSPRVAIQLGGLDLFDRTGVLFVDVPVSPELTVLQQAVAKATAQCGFIAELRPYHPHITLARLARRDQDHRTLRSKLANWRRLSGFAAGEFVLYESFLTPAGARYEIRGHFPLI